MKRLKDSTGTVHFGSPDAPICGFHEEDMLGKLIVCKTTTDSVTCPDCAHLYCQIKNAPWNEVESRTLDDAIYTAVGAEPPKHDIEEEPSCE